MVISNSFWRLFSTTLIPVLAPLALMATEPTAPPAAQGSQGSQVAQGSQSAPAAPSMSEVEAAWARGDFVFVRQGLKHLAENGTNMQAQYRYGRVLMEGRGGPQDLMAARDWLERAAAQNQASAAVLLARLYLSAAPGGPARNPERAAVVLRSAAVRGHGEAQYYLGLLYRSGEGVRADPVESLTWMQAAAENGNVEAQFELSRAYAEGLGTAVDSALALVWLQQAAEAGHSEAQYWLAFALDSGRGVLRNRAAGLNWLLRAAEGGFLRAQVALGKKYLTGEGAPVNPHEALRWLSLGVAADDLDAKVALGLALMGGQGIAANLAQARQLLSEAAAEGVSQASFALGQIAEQQEAGFGEAVKMYRQAVDQGSDAAARRLGGLAIDGRLEGLMAPHRMVAWVMAVAEQAGQEDEAGQDSQDGQQEQGAEAVAAAGDWLRAQAVAGLRPAQAAFGQLLLTRGEAAAAAPWLTKAAAAGEVQAQHDLGRLYIQGDGVQQDYVQAHKWLNVAAAGGSSAALEMRAVVADLMTPEQVAEAQTLARQFFAAAKPNVLPSTAPNVAPNVAPGTAPSTAPGVVTE
ncbi:SEL1-like repeat protein [Pseudophaeobacter arcticus]|uniref:SEL1-like repeat protein n=1 Tax=Pseudophaeobacter arcticus TaxID=385492 RepID=UPI003A97B979